MKNKTQSKEKPSVVKKYKLEAGKPGQMLEQFKAKKSAMSSGKMHYKVHGNFKGRHKMAAAC